MDMAGHYWPRPGQRKRTSIRGRFPNRCRARGHRVTQCGRRHAIEGSAGAAPGITRAREREIGFDQTEIEEDHPTRRRDSQSDQVGMVELVDRPELDLESHHRLGSQR